MKKSILFILFFFATQNCFSQYTLNPFYPSSDINGKQFGTNVDVDNNEVLVSSVSFEPTSNIGKVYLFNQIGGNLTQADVFYPSDALISDNFGSSISIKNNFIAIGSPMHDFGFENSGAVYLYKKIGNAYQLLQKINAFDANIDDHFGSYVKIWGNHLFISATENEPTGQDINTNSGAVYCYNFDGTQWVFSEKLTAVNSLKFGEKIEAENDKIVISCRGLNTATNFVLNSYNWNTINWVFESTCDIFGSLEQIVSDFSLSNNQLYLITTNLDTDENVLVLSNNTGNWNLTDNIVISDFSDQIFTKIKVDNNTMLIGSSGYTLQIQRNFPLLYYKKSGANWVYGTALFGTGVSGEDDNFGTSMSISGNSVIVGASIEGINSLGKAYYLDITLNNNQFEKKKAVIYPNPTNKTVFIQNSSSSPVEKAEVFSITGKLLFTADKNLEQLSLEKLSDGIYFIKVSFNQGSEEFFKVIKK
ncbi:MAG: T9SS type A sorting domain-containing protein [Bacteroidota bacterium]